jgi:hypothetical protein
MLASACEATGAMDIGFGTTLIQQYAQVAATNNPVPASNSFINTMNSLRPQDEIEACCLRRSSLCKH